MSKQGSNAGAGGTGLLSLVFLVLLTLKLAGVGVVAGWSWWWVTAPLWGGLALVLLVLGGAVVYVMARAWLGR